MKVPLNYKDAGGTEIDVAISRISTAKKGKRRGVLVINPGGPALPGLDVPGERIASLPSSVLDQYDLIGFDPRGVQHSTPQSCGLGGLQAVDLFPYPAADGSITANVKFARSTAEKCASSADGKNLKYYTTANTARDLDQIRQALGEKKLSYWGQSYGTYLGAVYRSLFPDRTDRMVLEGNIDPAKAWQGEFAGWSKGMADRFPDAAAAAAAQNDTLGLGATAAKVTRTYLTLADRLDRKPVTFPGTSASLTGPLLRNLTYALLEHNETIPALTQIWKAALDLADGSLTKADAAVLKQAAATGATSAAGVPADNQTTMFLALSCGDAAWSKDVDGYTSGTAADRASYPLTAGMPADIWACSFWKDKPIEAPVTVTGKGSRDVLLLQNKRDNATPYEGAVGLRDALAKSAAFVSVDNGGHYVYNEGSQCADAAMVSFLGGGRLPSKDVYCTDVSAK
ncbi:alpha/beta hydrolase [Streptomyces sp. NPDC005423]|uniref:alpha/beta hydrolase n=1 Tax=Streptomyces sp. NPDC005423 TaxID=3155343 RepID=UPI00339DCFDF